MLRSLPDQNEPLLRVESFRSDQRCRSLLASAKRPVRHSAPLQLSCPCKAQEVSLIDSWRADSESLSMALARNYPMCKNTFPGKSVREARTCSVSGRDGSDQPLGLDDIHGPGQVIGQNRESHFRGDFRKRFGE